MGIRKLAIGVALLWLIARALGLGATRACVDGIDFGGCHYFNTWFGVVAPSGYYFGIVVEAALLALLLALVLRALRRHQ